MSYLESIQVFSEAGRLAHGLHVVGFEDRALHEWNASAVYEVLSRAFIDILN
jgi:hypothetical protein